MSKVGFAIWFLLASNFLLVSGRDWLDTYGYECQGTCLNGGRLYKFSEISTDTRKICKCQKSFFGPCCGIKTEDALMYSDYASGGTKLHPQSVIGCLVFGGLLQWLLQGLLGRRAIFS
ncbi:hypothetical protein EGW08_012754 [Elysia chlorotica]|uniref:EGF-like domain-containing protein n=1 Tax=Elysia chlorotica TaxID=188477 RepID=A0A3S1A0C8_ELYCH|nr:hypothetical protein EGW08_012754 [Elysia chlorotica]